MRKQIILVASFLIVVSFIFNFGIPSAKAMTTAGIQALIQSLRQQLVQLQKQLTETQEKSASWCHNFNTNLQKGDAGVEATALQVALQKEGLLTQASEEFNELIASAVVGFQERYKLEILTPYGLESGTGFVGKGTRAQLNKLYGCKVVSTPAPAPAQTQTPATINVTYPNNGGMFQNSSIMRIEWTYLPLPASRLAINLWQGGKDAAVAQLKYCNNNYIQSNATQQYFYWDWRVGYDADGKAIPLGKYRIHVYNCADAGDASDVSFSTANGIALDDAENQLAGIGQAVAGLLKDVAEISK